MLMLLFFWITAIREPIGATIYNIPSSGQSVAYYLLGLRLEYPTLVKPPGRNAGRVATQTESGEFVHSLGVVANLLTYR